MKARLICHYLPQFHPIPENDKWWGEGFTEWTNVKRARPLFQGHDQPKIPGELGYYDLRRPETRDAQASLAKEHGIEGFCYWHYWFAGKRLLERPFNEVLQSGKPDIPFCLGWANESWSGIWHGVPNRVLQEQTYPGSDDEERHFHEVHKAFVDPRYITVNGKPLFFVYKPHQIPDVEGFIEHWQNLAMRSGLAGVHFVGQTFAPPFVPAIKGFDAMVQQNIWRGVDRLLNPQSRLESQPQEVMSPSEAVLQAVQPVLRAARKLRGLIHSKPDVIRYQDFIDIALLQLEEDLGEYPAVAPNWDNTPRCGARGYLFEGVTPELFRKHLRRAISLVAHRDPDRRIVFIKSWNEWAEGNYLEPDRRNGRKYLEVCRDEVAD